MRFCFRRRTIYPMFSGNSLIGWCYFEDLLNNAWSKMLVHVFALYFSILLTLHVMSYQLARILTHLYCKVPRFMYNECFYFSFKQYWKKIKVKSMNIQAWVIPNCERIGGMSRGGLKNHTKETCALAREKKLLMLQWSYHFSLKKPCSVKQSQWLI